MNASKIAKIKELCRKVLDSEQYSDYNASLFELQEYLEEFVTGEDIEPLQQYPPS